MGRSKHPNTLAVFIQALQGNKLVIELRSDAIVRGTLLSADDHLNMQLEHATVKSLDGKEKTASSMYIRGSSVRFIHLPGNLDPASAIATHRRNVADMLREQRQQQQQGTLPKGTY